jgi:anti-sigma factor RsiW
MSFEHAMPSCTEVSPVLPELALGVLTGRDRATALAHVESCSRCADELEQLSRAADAVVRVSPELEPPLGFEVRLFSRMGVSEEAVPRVRRFRFRTWALASAAAVVALFIGLAVGWSLPSPSTGHTGAAVGKPAAGSILTSAALKEGGRSVGRVSTSNGTNPWMFMTLDDTAIQGAVTCQVVTADGVTHTVGTFTVKHGYGAWGAPLPVPPGDVRQAQVVTPKGTVIATATLS